MANSDCQRCCRCHRQHARRLADLLHFHIIGNMETKIAISRLAALAHDTRLGLFRRLVQIGPPGLTPGELAAEFGLAAATLSFHLKELSQAGLLQAEPEGRFIRYRADFEAMQSLLGFLSDNCCSGQPCAVQPHKKRKS
ncbi:MAG: ArsR/SmtB family transcription factor [Moraxellaceae bacterium]